MPFINIYGNTDELSDKHYEGIKNKSAELLSCLDRTLDPKEISIRPFQMQTHTMTTELEVVICAHDYPEHVEKQDEICKEMKKYLMRTISGIHDASVRLSLSPLGHSF